ncbi:MAG: DNA transfer protein p32 [Pseudomonadota bacterium]
MPPVIIAGGIAAAGAITAASMSSSASENAANTQAGAANSAANLQANAAKNAQALQYQEYQQQRADMQPYTQAGYGALAQMQDKQFTQQPTQDQIMQYGDPSYKFRFQQGQQALEASAAARGQQFSGNTLKALNDYGQGSAQQGYQSAFNNYYTAQNTVYNRLAGVAGMGQGALNQQGQAGQNYANNATNAMVGGANAQAGGITGAANAQGAGMMASANAWGNGISSIGNAANSGANNWMQYSLMNKLVNQQNAANQNTQPANTSQILGGGATPVSFD